MEKELPKIDLPEEWIVGTGISKELLSLYTNFPCRIKSEIFVLCMSGEVESISQPEPYNCTRQRFCDNHARNNSSDT